MVRCLRFASYDLVTRGEDLFDDNPGKYVLDAVRNPVGDQFNPGYIPYIVADLTGIDSDQWAIFQERSVNWTPLETVKVLESMIEGETLYKYDKYDADEVEEYEGDEFNE